MQYRYKTNINCLGCVGQVKPHLDQLEQSKQIQHWHVDLDDPDRTLTIETNDMSADEIRFVVSEAGFNAEPKP